MNKYDKLINFIRQHDYVLELVNFYTEDKRCKHYTILNKSKTVLGLLSNKDSTVDKRIDIMIPFYSITMKRSISGLKHLFNWKSLVVMSIVIIC